MELGLGAAAEPVAQCMAAFLGPRYGGMVARAVSRDTGREFTIDPGKAASQVSPGQVLIQGSEGLTGTVLLIVRRQLSRMALGVGQRVVGAILSRIVGIVAGGVGIALIAKDIWDFRHGVLPIISTEMKSAETRDKVQDELGKVIGDQISEHVREISGSAADRVTDIWREFRRAHAKVLELAEKDERFRNFLETVTPAKLPRLDEVVALVLAGEGEPALTKRLNDGTLHRAVETMPPEALSIARDTRSLETAFKWWALAGDNLGKVVDHEIHRRGPPEEMSKAGLDRLLALDDRVAISRLAALTRGEREPLLELQPSDLSRLARAMPETDLRALSRYMAVLDKPAGQRLLAAVGLSPAKMAAFSAPGVQQAILASRDQIEAVAVIARSDGIFDFPIFIQDVKSVREGRVSPLLLWARYPIALSVFAFALPHSDAVRMAPAVPAADACHRGRTQYREREGTVMRLLTTETVDDAEIVRGEIVYAVAVSGANIVRDMREAIVNTIGGHMTRYENLLDQTIARALETLSKRADREGLRRRARNPPQPPDDHQRCRRSRRVGDGVPLRACKLKFSLPRLTSWPDSRITAPHSRVKPRPGTHIPIRIVVIMPRLARAALRACGGCTPEGEIRTWS